MISMIVPCYNAGSTITKTIESLKEMTGSDVQIVMVDDGSTDGSAKLLDSLASDDGHIKVIHQENRGLMGAWKRGVLEAQGDHIAFCDADDYVDSDLTEKINGVISEYDPDVIVYGMISEYPDGTKNGTFNRIKKGFYDTEAVKNEILPHLLSDGSMQSGLLIKSRWTKVIRKDLLFKVMPLLDEEVSLGEDELTVFAVMQEAKSLYCMGDYCPYHYVRNSGSMIGAFDRAAFEKLDVLYREMDNIAQKYNYPYPDQILQERLSNTLLFVKKYICRSSDGYGRTIDAIKNVRASEAVERCVATSIKGYRGSSRLFANLFKYRMYMLLYFCSRSVERIRGRDI